MRSAALIAALLGTLGCGVARPVGGARRCVDWENDVQPAFATHCVTCHSGANPSAGYDATSYLRAIGVGAGERAAVAGNGDSKLVATLSDARAPHDTVGSLAAMVRTWVVDCDLAYSRAPIHPHGILDPESDDFHGTMVRRAGWQFDTCQGCHGDDFSGGKAEMSCRTCHVDGPTGCSTCHGQPPDKGAHRAHAGGALARSFDCVECHIKPSVYTDVGHLFDADRSVITTARVTFGTTAMIEGKHRQGSPTWDRQDRTCANVYCHGATLGDAGAVSTRPTWEGQVECGKSCHGLPPSSHSSEKCVHCHPKVVDAQSNVIDKSRHVDGLISLGNEDGTCSACHGSSASPAPPNDLLGNATSLAVGAHQAHLHANRFRGPIACRDCHEVPTTVDAPGHIDHPYPAEVFPPASEANSLAWANVAKPRWNHATATCENVYCHGNGIRLSGDAAPSVHRSPVWTDAGSVICGTCHGIPPLNWAHDSTLTLDSCAGCHSKTIDAFGNLIITGSAGAEVTTHINGVVDVP